MEQRSGVAECLKSLVVTAKQAPFKIYFSDWPLNLMLVQKVLTFKLNTNYSNKKVLNLQFPRLFNTDAVRRNFGLCNIPQPISSG